MTAHNLAAAPGLAASLATQGYRGLAERGFTLRLHAFDWNYPEHITPRWTAAEMEAMAGLHRRQQGDLNEP